MLAACCLETSGSSSGVGGGGGLGTEDFVFGGGWSGDRFGGANLPSRTFRGLAFGATWDADAAQLLMLPAGSTVRPRSVGALPMVHHVPRRFENTVGKDPVVLLGTFITRGYLHGAAAGTL